MQNRFVGVRNHAIAISSVALITWVRWALLPILGLEAPLLLYVLPIMLCALIGGLWLGMFATVLGAAAGSWYFVRPVGHILPGTLVEGIILTIFVLIGLVVSLLSHVLRTSRERALEAREEMVRALASERRAMEASARSANLLKTVIESTPDCIFVKDRENRWLLANSAVLSVIGKNASEIIGKNELEWHSNLEEAKAIIATDRRVMELGEPVTLDEEWTASSGEKRYFFATKAPLRDENGDIVGLIGISRDSTARRNFEDALRKALRDVDRERRKLETLLEALPVGVVLADEKGAFTRMNRLVHRIWGGAPPMASVDDYGAYKGFWPESGTRLAPHEWPLARALLRREVVSGEMFDIERFDGRRATILNFAAPVLDTDGKLVGAVVTIADVTDLKAATDALAESEERFRRAFHNSPFPIAIHCEDGTVVSVNDSWTRISGYSREDIPTISEWTRRAYGIQAREVATHVAELYSLKTSRDEGEYVVTCANGSERIWHFSSAPLGHDPQGRRLVISIAMDVTERKRAENQWANARRIAEERAEELETIFAALQDAVFVYDKSGQLSRFNPAANRMTGLDVIDASRWPEVVRQLDFRFLDGRPSGFDALPSRRAIRGEHVRRDQFMFTSALGDVITVEANASPLVTEGQVRGAVAVWHDVTERRRSEMALARARDEAQAASRAKSAFLANMSHEIRTPLNAILGFSDLLDQPTFSEAEKSDFLKHVRRSGRQLMALIDDVLDLSKVEADRLTIERAPVSIADLLAEIQSSFMAKCQEKRIDFRVSRSGRIPTAIISDATRIRQVLFNVVGNAVKFTPAGGEVSVFVSYDHKARSMRFEVKDTGVGIAEHHREKIFEPFQQADDSVTRQFGGTGLGLTLSRRIARLLGGDLILVYSEVGKGSVFAVTLQAHDLGVESPPEPEEFEIRKANLGGMSILVAEDVPEAQLLMRRFLEMQGARVTIAENGQEAVDRAIAQTFDAILMDIRMPVKDGLAATRELRAKGYRGKILALTAHAFQEEQEETREAGCDGHLSKPVSLQTLLGALGVARTNS